MTETFSGCRNHPSDGRPRDGHPHHCAHVVVHPLDSDPGPDSAAVPGRRVEVLGQVVGQAGSIADLGDLCRQAGLPDLDLTLPGSVEWIGGDARTWPPRTATEVEK